MHEFLEQNTTNMPPSVGHNGTKQRVVKPKRNPPKALSVTFSVWGKKAMKLTYGLSDCIGCDTNSKQRSHPENNATNSHQKYTNNSGSSINTAQNTSDIAALLNETSTEWENRTEAVGSNFSDDFSDDFICIHVPFSNFCIFSGKTNRPQPARTTTMR